MVVNSVTSDDASDDLVRGDKYPTALYLSSGCVRQAYMIDVLGDGWDQIPDSSTQYDRKVQDLHSRFQSVPLAELETILYESGGDVSEAVKVLGPMDLQLVVRAQAFGKEQIRKASEMTREDSTALLAAMTPTQRASTLACMAPQNFILTSDGKAFGVDCVLCEEPMCHGELMQELRPCMCHIHAECIGKWLLTPEAVKLECPNCKQPMKDRSSALDSMTSEDRSETLAAMPFGDRAQAAEEYGARKVAALMIMAPQERRKYLVALSAMDRAAILSAMSPEDEAAALAVMPASDRATSLAVILQVLHPSCRGARLAIMSPEERASTLAAMSQEERSSTLAALSPTEKALITAPMLATALLPWLHGRRRSEVILNEHELARDASSLTPDAPSISQTFQESTNCAASAQARPGTAVYDEQLFETRLLTPLSSVFQLDTFVKGLDDETSSSDGDDARPEWSDSDLENPDEEVRSINTGVNFEKWVGGR